MNMPNVSEIGNSKLTLIITVTVPDAALAFILQNEYRMQHIGLRVADMYRQAHLPL